MWHLERATCTVSPVPIRHVWLGVSKKISRVLAYEEAGILVIMIYRRIPGIICTIHCGCFNVHLISNMTLMYLFVKLSFMGDDTLVEKGTKCLGGANISQERVVNSEDLESVTYYLAVPRHHVMSLRICGQLRPCGIHIPISVRIQAPASGGANMLRLWWDYIYFLALVIHERRELIRVHVFDSEASLADDGGVCNGEL